VRRQQVGPGLRELLRPNERGSSAVEIVLVLPALMLMILAGFQFAMYGLASHAVAAAVSEGGAAARATGGGTVAAEKIVGDETRLLAGGLLVDPKISVHEQVGAEMVVAMSAGVPSLIPGVHLVVHSTSAGPAQGFRASG
jgi:hypothetical protein